MSDERIEVLLDLWEDQADAGKSQAIAAFVAAHCRNDSPEVVDRFRQRVRKLDAVDAALGVGQSPPAPTLRLTEDAEPIDGYRLVSRIGSGSFGEVWKANAPGGFQVALKFIPCSSEAARVEHRSLKVIQGVRHPHLLTLFGAWSQHGYLIIASELAESTLLDRFRDSVDQGLDGVPRSELLQYIADAASGIDHLNRNTSASSHGIQHRDIKPANLFLSGGRVKVGDFGIARPLIGAIDEQTGRMTMSFAPPEAYGQQLANTSDQYSLALTYVFLRTGRLPFSGSPLQVMARKQDGSVELSFLTAEERPVLMRALAASPTKRYESCSNFVKTLQNVSQADARPKNKLNSQMRRYGLVVTALVLIAIGMIATVPLKTSDTNEDVDNSVVAPGLQEVESHSGPPVFIETLKSWPDMVRIVRNGEAAYDESREEVTIPVRLSVNFDQYRDWTQRLVSESRAIAEPGRDVVLRGGLPVRAGLGPSTSLLTDWKMVNDAAVLFGPTYTDSGDRATIWLLTLQEVEETTLRATPYSVAVERRHLSFLDSQISMEVVIRDVNRETIVEDNITIEWENWGLVSPRGATDVLPLLIQTALRESDGRPADIHRRDVSAFLDNTKPEFGPWYDKLDVNILLAPFAHKLTSTGARASFYYSPHRDLQIRLPATREDFDRTADVQFQIMPLD